MARTVKIPGDNRPPSGPESAPSAKPRAGRRSTTGTGGAGGSSAPGVTPEPKMSADDKKLHASLTRMYTMVGVAVTGMGMARSDIGLATAGVNITSMAEDTSSSWIELAQQNPKVRRALNGLVTGSAAANVIGSNVAMIAPILAARGAVPPPVGAMFLSDDAKAFYNAQAAAANNGTPQG